MFYILAKVEKICKYIRIKGLSSIRLFYEIPFVYKLVMAIAIGFAGYILLSVELQVAVKTVVVCLCIFVLLGMSLCSLSFREKVLLKTLCVNIFAVLYIRLLLLSIPFFLINIYIGLIVATTGSLCVILLQGVNADKSKQRLPSFYRKTSYQWLSSFRRGGLWVLVAGFLLFVIALYHGNENMMYASFGWLMCAPCIISYYTASELRFWLVIYKSGRFLLKSKLTELLINALFPALICLPSVAFFMSAQLLVIVEILMALLFVNVLLFYSLYLFYPSGLRTIIFDILIMSVWPTMTMVHPEVSVVLSVLVLPILHILTIQNLKSTLYAKLIS